MNDIQQIECDVFEKKVLTDIFGGYNTENMTINFGIFKYDLSSKVQKYISLFEEIAVPYMDEQGLIDGAKIKPLLQDKYQVLVPDSKFRLVDIYSNISPLIGRIKQWKNI